MLPDSRDDMTRPEMKEVLSEMNTQIQTIVRGKIGKQRRPHCESKAFELINKPQAAPHTGTRHGCPSLPYVFVLLLSGILADVDARLLAHGVPTNTSFVDKQMHDVKYADDTLLFAINIKAVEKYLRHLQAEASTYGLLLILTKTELLRHPQLEDSQERFKEKQPNSNYGQVQVPGVPSLLGKPTLTAGAQSPAQLLINYNICGVAPVTKTQGSRLHG